MLRKCFFDDVDMGNIVAKKLELLRRIFNQVPNSIGVTMDGSATLKHIHREGKTDERLRNEEKEDAFTSAKCASCCGMAWDGMSHN